MDIHGDDSRRSSSGTISSSSDSLQREASGSNGRRHRHYHHHRHSVIDQSTPPTERVAYLLRDYDSVCSTTHPIFSEIDELVTTGNNELEWKETARWLRYEEDVEEGSNRWSKPHVATLSLHSLLELRCLLVKKTIILDMVTNSLEDLLEQVMDDMVAKKLLSEENKDHVRAAILHKKSEACKRTILKDFPTTLHRESSTISQSSSVIERETFTSMTRQELPNATLMKQIPPRTEASNILIGEVGVLTRPISAFVRLAEGVRLTGLTEIPVNTRFVFILLGPVGGISRYHEIGRAVATIMTDDVFHLVAYKATNREDLLAGFDEFLDSVTVIPPGEWDPSIRIDPPENMPRSNWRLNKYTNEKEVDEELASKLYKDKCGLFLSGHFFGGLVNDIKQKLPWYLSDFKDGFSIQSISTIIYMYFVCLTPIITFGEILGDFTEGHIASAESLLAAVICGVTYALTSGQPLAILGETGPVLVFDKMLYQFCKDQEWEYLPFRLWVGVWIGLILITVVAFDGVAFISFITRFTEDTFTMLIAIIFIFEAIRNIKDIGDKYPVMPTDNKYVNCTCAPTNNTRSPQDTYWAEVPHHDCIWKYNGTMIGEDCKYHPDIFLLSVILASGTFLISVCLKYFRDTPFLCEKVRFLISDFAVVIAIVAMTSADYFIRVPTPKLSVPTTFRVTNPSLRGWFISPASNNPWWTPLVACIPGLVASILLFMDQCITTLMINRRQYALQKGCGYHLDLFILGFLVVICSCLGLPWFVAETVQALNHVNALRVLSIFNPPGQSPLFIGVREQRLTALVTFIFIGMSVLMVPVLAIVPRPVLYGVFFDMGASVLTEITLFERVCIMMMVPRLQPDLMVLRKVKLSRVNLFTSIQMACLAVMWGITKTRVLSMYFPLMLIAMVGMRKLLDYVFTEKELKYLDHLIPKKMARKGKVEDAPLHNVENKKRIEWADMQGASVCGMSSTVNITDELNSTHIWQHVKSSMNTDPSKMDSHVFFRDNESQ